MESTGQLSAWKTRILEAEEVLIHLERIVLQNLSEEDVNALSADTSHCNLLESTQLAQLIYSKTAGNAFFTHQVLRSLDEDGLLTFDGENIGCGHTI